MRRQLSMPFVYVLKSVKVDNWHYIGSCHELEARLKQHKKGSVRSTKSRRPFILIYQESHATISDARKREYFLKSPKGYLEKVKIISECKIMPG